MDMPTCDALQNITPQVRKIITAIARIRLNPLPCAEFFPAGEPDYLEILVNQNLLFFRNNNRFSWHCNLSDSLGFFIKSKPFRCFGYTIHATKKCIGLGFFNRIISSNILGDGNRRVRSESRGGIRAPIAWGKEPAPASSPTWTLDSCRSDIPVNMIRIAVAPPFVRFTELFCRSFHFQFCGFWN